MEELLRRHGGNGAVSDDAKRQFRDGLWDMVAPGPAGTAARRVVGADRCFQLRGVMLQQQEVYQQQLAALHALVEAQMILEDQAAAAPRGAATYRHMAPPQPPASAAAAHHGFQHAALPNASQPQHTAHGAPAGFAAQVGRMQLASPQPPACPTWHPPPQHAPPQQPPPQQAAPMHDHGIFGDAGCIGGPAMQPLGGGLFTWHEEADDALMDIADHQPPLLSRCNSWDPPIPMPTGFDGMAPLQSQPDAGGGGGATTWDGQQQFRSLSPLRKRQAVEPSASQGQVLPPGPDWCCPSDFSPRSPALSPHGQLWDFQRKPRALFERSSGDSNVSTTSALDLDAFIGGGMWGPTAGAGAVGYGTTDGCHQMAQWGGPLRGGDANGASQMLGHPGPNAHDSQWQFADLDGFFPRPGSAGPQPLDERRALAWNDLRASFVP